MTAVGWRRRAFIIMKRLKYTNMSMDIQIYIHLFLSFGDAEAVLNLSSI